MDYVKKAKQLISEGVVKEPVCKEEKDYQGKSGKDYSFEYDKKFSKFKVGSKVEFNMPKFGKYETVITRKVPGTNFVHIKSQPAKVHMSDLKLIESVGLKESFGDPKDMKKDKFLFDVESEIEDLYFKLKKIDKMAYEKTGYDISWYKGTLAFLSKAAEDIMEFRKSGMDHDKAAADNDSITGTDTMEAKEKKGGRKVC